MFFAVNSPSRNSTNPVITGLGRLRLMNSLPEGQESFGNVNLTMPSDILYILPISISDCGGIRGRAFQACIHALFSRFVPLFVQGIARRQTGG